MEFLRTAICQIQRSDGAVPFTRKETAAAERKVAARSATLRTKFAETSKAPVNDHQAQELKTGEKETSSS